MTNRRKIILLLGCIVAFMVAYFLLVLKDEGKKIALEPTYSTHFTDEFGLDALFNLLKEENIPVERNYFRVGQADLYSSDNLVLLAPSDRVTREEADSLIDLVERGMDILICFRRGGNFLSHHGIETVESSSLDAYQTGSLAVTPSGPHSILSNVNKIAYIPPAETGLGRASHDYGEIFSYFYFSDTLPVIPVLEDKGEVHVGYVRMGRGRIFLFSSPYIFSNGGIGQYDNAILAMNVIRSMCKTGERIVFDECHQGFTVDRLSTPLNEPEVRYMMWGFIAVFALSIYSLSRRVGRPQAPHEEPRRHIIEFVQSVAQIYRRKGEEGMVYAEIVSRFLLRIKNTFGLRPEQMLKVDKPFLISVARKWGKPEAKSLALLMEKIKKTGGEAPIDELLEVVADIRQFSIRNKIDVYGQSSTS